MLSCVREGGPAMAANSRAEDPMSTVIRFPVERRMSGSRAAPRSQQASATIIILPVVRIERRSAVGYAPAEERESGAQAEGTAGAAGMLGNQHS